MLYGILVGQSVVLTDQASGKKVVETVQPDSLQGYVASSAWHETPTEIIQSWTLKPIEGTAEEAALALSKLQFMSLPDEAAYQFRALADEWIAGATYYGPDDASGFPQSRVRYQGELYKCLQTHVSQRNWTPTDAPSLWSKILPGQEGNTPEEGYAEWIQPDSTNGYDKGDRVLHNGHLWESNFDGANVWEPGAVGAPWTDLGVYPSEE